MRCQANSGWELSLLRPKMELATSPEGRTEKKKSIFTFGKVFQVGYNNINWTEELSSMKQKNLKSFSESEHKFNLKKFTQTSLPSPPEMLQAPTFASMLIVAVRT